MISFCFLAAFLLVNRLKKAIRVTPLYYKWKTQLELAFWGSIGLYIAVQATFNPVMQDLTGAAALGGMLYYLDQQEDFKSFKTFFKSHYPLVGVILADALARLIAPKLYDSTLDNYFGLAIVGCFVWIFARISNIKKQQEELRTIAAKNDQLDALVAQRTAELTKQKNELEETVKLLKATQAQLIQQEKLASLGELTAGIAHEIQNPLNFVNNFSEVSMELIDEMEEELNKGDKEEAMAIAGDIKQNLEKIIHHGRRADGIVKGMLQHSRASSDTLEPTDLNKLADEYLRLAYHGLRAKDKSFNAELITGYAQNLPQITVVSQDVGRVLLNLFTNAFYAVQQRQKIAGADFRPTVEVNTLLSIGADGRSSVKIMVKDNGTGIPEAVKDKIMQPFFTTKPTGEGTGLGLSLSYDIIVKGHKGNIDVASKEGEFTMFTISLPLN